MENIFWHDSHLPYLGTNDDGEQLLWPHQQSSTSSQNPDDDDLILSHIKSYNHVCFDNSDVVVERVPIISTEQKYGDDEVSGNQLFWSRTKGGTGKVQGGRSRNPKYGTTSLDHVMAERKRRHELAEKFIALSATIPGLKKKDKASVLDGAINHVKQLQERVKELEEKANNKKKSIEEAYTCGHNNSHDHEDDDVVPADVEARASGREVLIRIQCKKQNGIMRNIVSLLQNSHLTITHSSVLPFGNTTLYITIITQMRDEYGLTVNDLEEEETVGNGTNYQNSSDDDSHDGDRDSDGGEASVAAHPSLHDRSMFDLPPLPDFLLHSRPSPNFIVEVSRPHQFLAKEADQQQGRHGGWRRRKEKKDLPAGLFTSRMGSGNWFKLMICFGKTKGKSKKAKGSLASGKPSAVESNNHRGQGFSDVENGTKSGSRVLRGISIETIAATRIQTAYRAYKARKSLHQLKGFAKLKVVIQRQTEEAIVATKLEAKLHDLEVEWCGGPETMEEILARIHYREEASVKRERALIERFLQRSLEIEVSPMSNNNDVEPMSFEIGGGI
ncbi:hypothetical protein K1719_021550 [Acacia pycnantha]|nr:hypothetical protein K1719_021550 [Acacia pycnantha]